MSIDPYEGMSEADVQQLGADRTRMFLYIAIAEGIPLLSLVAALANIIKYGVTIALLLVAAVVNWFIITATIAKMPESTPEAMRRPTRMLRLAFTASPLLIAVVVWFIFNGASS